jgi:hypothetical protein
MSAKVEIKDYDYRRGAIEVTDSRSGMMRCSHCGNTWMSNLRSRPGKYPVYYRGCWTCSNCGANTKSKWLAPDDDPA